MIDFEMSQHAMLRAAQRNVSPHEIAFIIKHGKNIHNAGALECQMWHKRMPKDLPHNDPLWRLVGTTVMLSKDRRTVITLYRDGDAFKRDRRKKKFDIRSH